MKQRVEELSLPVLGVGTGGWKWGDCAVCHEDIHVVVEGNLARAAAAGKPALFDTAPRYGLGYAECCLGEALKGVPRERFRLSSKTGYLIEDEDMMVRLGRDDIFRSVEGSLQRLQQDHLDILLLHDPDCCLEDALDTAFPAMMALREQGMVRAIGAGMNQWEMLDVFIERADLDICLLAGRYTLLEHEARGFLDRCAEKGTPVMLGGMYNSGILATGAAPGARYRYVPAPPEIMDRVRRMEEVCAHYKVPLNAAALQFGLRHPAVASLVVGVISERDLNAAWDGLAVEIPEGLWAELEKI